MFSDKIDSAINGYALGISFVGIGVFLLLNPDYFAIPIVSYIIGAIIGIIGVLGTGVELSKASRVKGLGNIVVGLIFLAVWLIGYLKAQLLPLNIVLFVCLIIGCYAVCLGLFQSLYSIIRNLQESRKEGKSSKSKVVGNFITQAVLFLTQVCGLIIAILNVMKATSI